MNENFTISETLVRYLDNELEEAERQELEQKLATDAALQTELENLRLAQHAVKHYGLRQQVSGIHREMIQELRQEKMAPPNIVRRIGRYSLRVAAAIIILLAVGVAYEYSTLSSGGLFKDDYSPYQLAQTRGTVNSSLQQEYSQSNMPGVTALFEQEAAPSIEDYFIAGNAYMQQNKAAKAIVCFVSIQQKNAQSNTHIYGEDADYYLGLAYLQNDEPKKALPLLTQVYNDKTNSYHDKISGWQLRKIEWLAGKK